MCGCKILYYKFSRSGIPIGLNNSNSKAFDDYNNISIQIFFLLNNYSYREVSSDDIYNFSENFTSKKLFPYLKKLYENIDQDYDGKLINLNHFSNKLANHYLNVPWFIENRGSSDIDSEEQLNCFIYYLNGDISKIKSIQKYSYIKSRVSIKLKFKYFLLQIRDQLRRK